MSLTCACVNSKLYGALASGGRIQAERSCLRGELRTDSMIRRTRKNAVPREPAAAYPGEHAGKVRARWRQRAGGKNAVLQIEF